MSELVLRLHDLRRSFKSGSGELVVLDGVNLEVLPGEIVGLIGPSGSGKSSLLHAAGLLERPTDGEVWVDGQTCWDLDDGARTAIRRDKIGFGTPHDEWFRTPAFQQYIKDIIYSQSFGSRGLVDVKKVQSLYDQHVRHEDNHGKEIWKWLHLENWFNKFID